MSLRYKVFRHSYLGCNSNSVLVYSENDAVLLDSSQLLSDSYLLVPQLIAMKKRITHIYVSHFHPDHHFGLEVLQFAFPKAKIVALPSVVSDIVFTSSDKLEMWDIDWLGRDIPRKTTIPMPMHEPRLEVEGNEIVFSDGWHGDSVNNSVAWIPSLKTVYAGDVCFHECHVWTVESNVERRVKWRKDLQRLKEEYDPRVIIPAHCGEAQMQILEEVEQDASRAYTDCADWSKSYLEYYEQAYNAAKTGAELVDMMMKPYGHIKPADFGVHWQAQLLFPRSSPDWLIPLPGKVGEIFLNPEGGFDGDPPKE
ncbi:MAG: MBL fold metallo-hydrolase [Actinobacteria bacterium]|nr:MBL fold metallo-hydrolase [Actinomycetota bacterium]